MGDAKLAGTKARVHISDDQDIVALHLDIGGVYLGGDTTTWMTLDELADLRDRCQVAIHVLRERAEPVAP